MDEVDMIPSYDRQRTRGKESQTDFINTEHMTNTITHLTFPSYNKK